MRPKKLTKIDDSRSVVYHVWSTTVRGAYLTGIDRFRKLDFSYREPWFHQRVSELAQVFAVECRDYVVFPRHFRMIVRGGGELTAEWSDDEVAARWLRLNSHSLGLRPAPSADEIQKFRATPGKLATARKRLASVSSYLGSLKQPIGRRANREDNTDGYFFESGIGCDEVDDDVHHLADLRPHEMIRMRDLVRGRYLPAERPTTF